MKLSAPVLAAAAEAALELMRFVNATRNEAEELSPDDLIAVMGSCVIEAAERHSVAMPDRKAVADAATMAANVTATICSELAAVGNAIIAAEAERAGEAVH